MKKPVEFSPVVNAAVIEGPKSFKVARAFQTHNRRFKPGDDIAPADLADSDLDFEHMKSKGFIATA